MLGTGASVSKTGVRGTPAEIVTYVMRDIAQLSGFLGGSNTFNAFNPFLIAEVTIRFNRTPEELLDRLHISRTFTVHQLELEALVTERIPSALKTYSPRS